MGISCYPCVALAEVIAGDFYNDWLDNSSRGMEPVKPWLLTPEVGDAHRVRELGALEQAVRHFLTLVCAVRNLSTTLRHRRFLFTDSFLLLWKWRVG